MGRFSIFIIVVIFLVEMNQIAIASDIKPEFKNLLYEYHTDCLRRRIGPGIAVEYTHQNEKLLKTIPESFTFTPDLKYRDYRPILHNINDKLIE